MIDFLIAHGAGIVSALVALLIVGGLVVTFAPGRKPALRAGWSREQGPLKITRRNPNAVNGVSVSYYSGRRDVVNWDWDNIISIEEV